MKRLASSGGDRGGGQRGLILDLLRGGMWSVEGKKEVRRENSSSILGILLLTISSVHGTELISISSYRKGKSKYRKNPSLSFPLQTSLAFLFSAYQKATPGGQLWEL